MRDPHKYDWAYELRDEERPSILPALLLVALIVVGSIVGWRN